MIRVNVPPNGLSVVYPLLFIEGTVEKQITSAVNVENDITLSRIVWPVVDCKFKCFVLLTVGSNKIVIRHEYFTKTVYVNRIRDTRDVKYLIQPLYVVFNDTDGTFQSPPNVKNTADSAVKRIGLACALLQTFTAINIGALLHVDPLYTFQFHYSDISHIPVCELFYTRYSSAYINQLSETEIWKLLAKELMERNLPHLHTTKYIMFLSCTRYDGSDWKPAWRHRDIVSATRAYSAIGGGGLAVLGTATLHTWAEELADLVYSLTDDTEIDRTCLMDDSAYRGTYWANYSTGLGAMLHELGHTLDLSHTGSGIMARGDDIHTFFILNGARPANQQLGFPPLHFKPSLDNSREVVVGDMAKLYISLIPNLEIVSSVTSCPTSPAVTVTAYSDCSTIQPYLIATSGLAQSPPALESLCDEEPRLNSSHSSHAGSSLTDAARTAATATECDEADFSSSWSLCSAVMLRYSRWLLTAEELKQSQSKPTGSLRRVEAEAGVRTVQIYCRCLDVIAASKHFILDPPREVFPADLMTSVTHAKDCPRLACLETHIRDSTGNLLKIKQ